MQAIASNALPDFEESIDNQQLLSARLSALANDLAKDLETLGVPLQKKPAIAQAAIDEDMAQQIRAADDTLQRLNRRYAALLQHSSRSVALMSQLFSSFQGQIQEASGPRLKHQTWSCQM